MGLGLKKAKGDFFRIWNLKLHRWWNCIILQFKFKYSNGAQDGWKSSYFWRNGGILKHSFLAGWRDFRFLQDGGKLFLVGWRDKDIISGVKAGWPRRYKEKTKNKSSIFRLYRNLADQLNQYCKNWTVFVETMVLTNILTTLKGRKFCDDGK